MCRRLTKASLIPKLDSVISEANGVLKEGLEPFGLNAVSTDQQNCFCHRASFKTVKRLCHKLWTQVAIRRIQPNLACPSLAESIRPFSEEPIRSNDIVCVFARGSV